MLTIRNAAVVAAAVLALFGTAVASVPPAASTINIDGMDVMPRAQLEARFPELSSNEIDKLLFRIADAHSVALLVARVG
jgi:hypothetical protein